MTSTKKALASVAETPRPIAPFGKNQLITDEFRKQLSAVIQERQHVNKQMDKLETVMNFRNLTQEEQDEYKLLLQRWYKLLDQEAALFNRQLYPEGVRTS